jgi:hypothetical protein
MIVNCKTCGKETNKKPYLIKQFGDKVYCSKPCFYNSISKPKVERTCEVCSKKFEVHASSIKYHGARFCGKECKDTFNRGEKSYNWKEKPKRLCKQCNREYEIDAWRLKDPIRGQFCTRECRYEYFVGSKSKQWQGGITKENVRIRSLKENRHWRIAVLERDKFTCVWCGSKSNLEVDHIKPFALYPELRTDTNNGRVLCKPCHQKTDTYAGKTRKMV